ncbi:MAG: hypothetical protein IKQ27_08315 [Lachnospiraceae bacterium]|nr:hypothetical protein [Lachnospiraceae bacterium]MBR6156949.1 hypothetical protein [Lachnospiraceae bacterium]
MNDKRSGVRKGIFRTIFAFAFILYGLLFCGSRARADMGPKPSISLTVVNAPQDYYIALLWHGNAGDNSELKLETVDEESIMKYLEDFCWNGWRYFRSPVGYNYYCSNAAGSYGFSYMVPDPFRVIIIDSDGVVYISDELDQEEYNASCTLDVSTGSLTENRTDKVLGRILYVVSCYLITLGVEYLIFKLFKYPVTKRNIAGFLIVNTITNLSLSCGTIILGPSAGLVMVFFGPVIEAAIMLIEGIVYAITLRDKDGQKRTGRAFLYSLVANLLSAVMGVVVALFLII